MTFSCARVVVVGAGLTGLSAAIAARESGADVTLVEKGNEHDAGGNAAFSGGVFMFCYDGPEQILALTQQRINDLEADQLVSPAYSVEDYVSDLLRMSDGNTDKNLAMTLATHSRDTMHWLVKCGVQFGFMGGGVNVRERTLYVLPGQALQVYGEGYTRGMYLIRPLLEYARAIGVKFRFSSPLIDVVQVGGRVVGITIQTVEGTQEKITADAVVMASGGYQGSRELRRKHLGPQWEHVRLRGTRHSDGSGIFAGVRAGAATIGDWSSCHSAAVCADTPSPQRNDEASPPALHGFWLGLMINKQGKRFVDEGMGLWSRNYSKMGKAIMQQPGCEAVQVFDQKTADMVRTFFTPMVKPVMANTIDELAVAFDLPADQLKLTLEEYSKALGAGEFNPSTLDGKSTRDLIPPKSNWAIPFDAAPYVAFHATAGLTFTFAGLSVNSAGQVIGNDGQPLQGLFAAGECCGGLFYGDYPAGAALMRAAVFGRIAGVSAATGNPS